MTTGWQWITSDGQTFRSQLYAREWLRDNPAGTVTFSELSMAGVKLTDVTKQFRASICNDAWPRCLDCGAWMDKSYDGEAVGDCPVCGSVGSSGLPHEVRDNDAGDSNRGPDDPGEDLGHFDPS